MIVGMANAAPQLSLPADSGLRASTLADDLGFLLARASSVAMAEANTALAAHDLRVRSFSVLALAAADAEPSQRDLAEFLRLDPRQIVLLIDELEREGLVERRPAPNDRRANVMVATARGRERYAAARAAVDAAGDRVQAGLSKPERSMLLELLRRVAFSDD